MRKVKHWSGVSKLIKLALGLGLALCAGCASHPLPATPHPDPYCDRVIADSFNVIVGGKDLNRAQMVDLESCAIDYATRLNCIQGPDTDGCRMFAEMTNF